MEIISGRMKTLMKVLCLFKVLTGVLMKSGNVYEGTVGESVEIRCPYQDDYKFISKYFCRHPCYSNHVLIKSAKTDQVVSDGRYSLINHLSARSFSVTIRHLRLTDSGVYYCGLDQWFSDTKNIVHLSVRPAAPVNRSTHTPENTYITYVWTTTLTSTDTSSQQINNQFYKIYVFSVSLSDKSDSYEQLSTTSSTVQSNGSTPLDKDSVCAGVLSFLVFWILVVLVVIYRRRSDAKSRYTAQDPPDFNQAGDDGCCEETVVVYSLDDPPKEDSFSLIYSTVYYCDHMTQTEK